MAFAFPIFLVLTLMLLALGQAYWMYNTMNYAVNEAGRFAMVNTSAVDEILIGKVTDNLIGIPSNDVSVEITDMTINGTPFKRIDASYTYKFGVLKGFFENADHNLTATAIVPANGAS